MGGVIGGKEGWKIQAIAIPDMHRQSPGSVRIWIVSVAPVIDTGPDPKADVAALGIISAAAIDTVDSGANVDGRRRISLFEFQSHESPPDIRIGGRRKVADKKLSGHAGHVGERESSRRCDRITERKAGMGSIQIRVAKGTFRIILSERATYVPRCSRDNARGQ